MVNYTKELFYVDYCNQCKDLDIMSPNNIPCHHHWYCHMDNGEVQELEFQIGKINHDSDLRGYMYASERETLKKLKQTKFELVKRKLREYRKKQRGN